MVCPKCECYYEYKGEVCLQEGQLTVKYAASEAARACLERMIRNLTGIEETKASEEKESKPIPSKQAPGGPGGCQISVYDVLAERSDPLNVVRDFDMMDDGDPEVPPQFSCEACEGEMYLEYYVGVQGYEYRFSPPPPPPLKAAQSRTKREWLWGGKAIASVFEIVLYPLNKFKKRRFQETVGTP